MDDAVDGRADQYGLAATAFHLLTGTPPFAHFNPSVVISKHLNERPPRPSDVRPDLTEFDAIFARALSQDPLDRFRRCRDFARALELKAASGHTPAQRPIPGHPTTKTPEARPCSPRRRTTESLRPSPRTAAPVTEVARAAAPAKVPSTPRPAAVAASPEPAAHYEHDDR